VTRVAVLGCGLIGRERIDALVRLGSAGHNVEIIGVTDPSPQAIALPSGVRRLDDIAGAFAEAPDLIIVATPHDVAEEIVTEALGTGARVLVEKPLGRSAATARRLASSAAVGSQLFVGHNYRFMPAIRALFADIERGYFGIPISMTLLMGHGNAPGQEKTWKLDPARAGGGALIDPGIHLLDLARIAGGRIGRLAGTTWSGFWNTGIEEDVHLLATGDVVPSISVQVSLVRWRSTFRIEFHGEDGYGLIEGRGRSYGPQSYVRGPRWGWQHADSQRAAEETVVVSDCADSFHDELAALLGVADAGRLNVCTAAEAVETMDLLERARSALDLY